MQIFRCPLLGIISTSLPTLYLPHSYLIIFFNYLSGKLYILGDNFNKNRYRNVVIDLTDKKEERSHQLKITSQITHPVVVYLRSGDDCSVNHHDAVTHYIYKELFPSIYNNLQSITGVFFPSIFSFRFLFFFCIYLLFLSLRGKDI